MGSFVLSHAKPPKRACGSVNPPVPVAVCHFQFEFGSKRESGFLVFFSFFLSPTEPTHRRPQAPAPPVPRLTLDAPPPCTIPTTLPSIAPLAPPPPTGNGRPSGSLRCRQLGELLLELPALIFGYMAKRGVRHMGARGLSGRMVRGAGRWGGVGWGGVGVGEAA